MSKQTGLIRLKGTIGGVTFYKSDGEDLARMANGPRKEKIDNDPAFQRTRENNREFGGSAYAAKALRLSLALALQGTADSRLFSRLMQLFKKINTKGIGTRGQRGIVLSLHKEMLVNFEFNRHFNFTSVCNVPFTASNNSARNEATLSIQPFMPSGFIRIPAGATHFRFIQAIGVVSDFEFNPVTNDYEPVNTVMNALGALSYSDYISVSEGTTAAITLATTLPNDPVVTGELSIIQCLGIEFHQQIAGVNYLLAQGNSMKVVKVF